MRFKKVLAIGDTHMPWMSKSAFSQVMDIARELKPEIIIQVGDLFDLYSFSRWPKKIIITPEQEIKDAREQACEFWAALKRRAPKAKCIQLSGNHDSLRLTKKLIEAMPEIADLVSFKHFWEFEGVKTYHDFKDEVVIDGILYTHGHRAKLGDHMKWHGMSVVRGHSHKPGIVIMPGKKGALFEMDVGYLADPTESALQYGQEKNMHWAWAVGSIDQNGNPKLHLLSNK